MFLDLDIVCLQPLDELVYRYSYFAHLEPTNNWNPYLNVNVGVLGSAPQSPVAELVEKYFLKYS